MMLLCTSFPVVNTASEAGVEILIADWACAMESIDAMTQAAPNQARAIGLKLSMRCERSKVGFIKVLSMVVK